MTIRKVIITRFDCTSLAANELSSHGQKLAKSLAALTTSYSTDHLIESRALTDKLRMYEAKKKVKQGYGLLGRIGHAKTSILPAPIKTMWQAWLDELLSSLVFEGFGSCGDLAGFSSFNSVSERNAFDDFGEVVKAA